LISALFVISNGPYADIDGVDAWPATCDARKYSGPNPVIAHPPCERWGKFSKFYGRVGEDDGCFMSSLRSVRNYGGVLEHPEGSYAFHKFELPIPAWHGGWSLPDKHGGRSCCVAQGNYGHRARKMTWLCAVLEFYPDLKWGPTPKRDLSHLPDIQRKRHIKTGICQRMSKRQRMVTPDLFRDLLLSLVQRTKGPTR
jgi:hypothetical protein